MILVLSSKVLLVDLILLVKSEDYTQMLETYPSHPLSQVNPKFKTLSDLKDTRKSFNIKDLSNKKEQWDKANPNQVNQPYIISEYLIDKPMHTTMKEVKSQKEIQARLKNGLLEKTTDVKESPFKLTEKYNPSPEFQTKAQLEASRKETLLTQLSKQAETNRLTEPERLKLHEESVYQ